jgi:replicative superfamily II helicase
MLSKQNCLIPLTNHPTTLSSQVLLNLQAPTGSGKTVILELAILHLLSTKQKEECKVVYISPTKVH